MWTYCAMGHIHILAENSTLHSDYVFLRITNTLTYLLTYLLTYHLTGYRKC